MEDRHRRERWLDFRRRAEYAPADVYRHRLHGWEYIPIHPFADEPELLTSLHIRPEECLVADAWWGVDEDATLLECRVIGGSVDTPGLIFQPRRAELPRWLHIQAVVDSPHVTRVVFEEIMQSAYRSGFPGAHRFKEPSARLILPL
jgi:hypothetical protein